MRKSTRWPAALALCAILVLALLSVVGSRLHLQEEALARERQRERLENAASLLTRESERALAQATADEQSSLTVEWNGRELRRTWGAPLVWSPLVPPAPGTDPSRFAEGERLEFRDRNPDQAIAAYRRELRTSDAALRAGALLRIARCQRALGRVSEALETYGQLAAMESPAVAGGPSGLVGRRERLVLLRTSGDSAGVERETKELQDALERGSFLIDRPTFEFYAQGLPIPAERTSWADAAAILIARAAEAPRGNEIFSAGGRRFLCEWSRDGRQWRGRLTDVQSICERLSRALSASPAAWRLTAFGQTIASHGDFAGAAFTRKAGETGLPWSVEVTLPAQPGFAGGGLTATGLTVLGLAILVTLYLAYRAIRRELRVAGMQSEFVAAVSHEFRSPITALTHLTDLLETGEPSAERRPLYYRAIARETRRLREMVENLLDFGRIEAGRYRYKPEPVDPAAFVADILDDFRGQPAGSNREISLEVKGATSTLALDQEAMRRAVWNLLDNAAKYSPGGSPICARVGLENGWTAISVEDRGCGVAREDRKRIFQKFVRGSVGHADAVKGTGIGLAMAQAIVRAHGGRIELESRPGEGSRFTILLPAEGRNE